MLSSKPANGVSLHSIASFSFVALLALLAYSRSFTGPFLFDDFNVIVNNWYLRHPLNTVFFLWARTRLLPYSTFALNFIIGGDNPVGYHIVNFGIHLITSLEVFLLSIALCRTPRVRNTDLALNPLLLALPAALVFACHPIQVQAVTYITQRMASLATLFYVGSILLYVRARLGASKRAWPWYVGSALFALAAFLSKENTASLPIAIVATETVFFAKDGKWRLLRRLGPFLVLVLLIPLGWAFVSFLNGFDLQQFVGDLRTAADPSATSALDYFFTQCIVLPRYLRLVVFPWGFNLDPDIPIAHGMALPVLVGLVFLSALFALGLYTVRRLPLVGFGILWFFISHSVESTFLPISDVMAEHRMYLAMPGLALAFASLFASAARRSLVAIPIGAAAVIALTVLTFLRNEVWRDPILLWQDTVSRSPHKVRPQINLGVALHEKGRLDEAIEHYCEALKLDPQNQTAENNIEIALDKKLDSGDVDLDLFVRKDGTREVIPVHPCPPPDKRRGQKTRQVGVIKHPLPR